MKEEGLLYDVQSGGFLHVFLDSGKLVIDKQPCGHDHATPMVVVAE